MTDLLLEATGIVKHYGAVAALRGASLSVRAGEVHALLGANGAGKSTLVKILTGTVRPDAGSIAVRGQRRTIRSAAEAGLAGIVSVYQDPSLVPDLTVAENLRLTRTPVDGCRDWLQRLGLPRLDLDAYTRELPLPTLRILDLARALATEPDIILLDEMTAALPADLTERVLDVVGSQRSSGRSIIFISHRLIEISRLCDRATVLRDGETVGVVDMSQGAEERIVKLMLGPIAEEIRDVDAATTVVSGPVGLVVDAPVAADATPPIRIAPRRAGPAVRRQARGCLVRGPQWRGPGRRGARGAGSGRAVRGARRIAPSDRGRDPR